MRLLFICKYCDFKWELDFYNTTMASRYCENLCCNRCDDKNVRTIEKDKHTIDTYAGSPPFEKKEEKTPLELITDDYDFMGD